MSDEPALLKLLHKLESRSPLDDGDRTAILDLPHVRRSHEASAYVLRAKDRVRDRCGFVLSGLAFRQKLAAGGARQIVSLHMVGDFLDLQHLFLDRADHSVQALSRIEIVEIDRAALQDMALRRPAVGRALWIEALVEASILREWVLNVGRRDARGRIAHLLCELWVRMEAAGMEVRGGYRLPLTQEQIGDAVGLTSVHVNRTFRLLAEEGLITRDRRTVRSNDLEGLRSAAAFCPLYLHLGEAGAI